MSLVVIVLEGHRKGFFVVGGVSEPGFSILREMEICSFIGNDRPFLVRRIETVGYALIIGSHLNTETITQFQVELVSFDIKLSLPVEWCLNGLGDTGGSGSLDIPSVGTLCSQCGNKQ